MIWRLVMAFVFCVCLSIVSAASHAHRAGALSPALGAAIPTTESPYPEPSSDPAEAGYSAEALKAPAALGHHKSPHHHHKKHHPKGIQEVKDLPGGGVLAYNMSEGPDSTYMSTKMTSGDDAAALTSYSPGKYSAAGAAMYSNGSDTSPAGVAYSDVDGSGVAIQTGYDDAAALKSHHHGHGHHHAKLAAFASKKHKHPGSEEEMEAVKVSGFGDPRGHHHHHKRPHSPVAGGDTDVKSVIPNHGLAEGWRHENPNSYWIKELAKIATREINTALNFAYHMKLLKVFQARSKISNQNVYKMEMEIAPTNCRIDSRTATDDHCQIQACSERQMCHVEITLTDDKAGQQFMKDYGCYTVQPPYLC